MPPNGLGFPVLWNDVLAALHSGGLGSFVEPRHPMGYAAPGETAAHRACVRAAESRQEGDVRGHSGSDWDIATWLLKSARRLEEGDARDSQPRRVRPSG